MESYTKVGEDKFGWHIAFDAPITEENFKQACQAAIALAKVECPTEKVVAINFIAQDLSVQVVETDDADIQFALWLRRLNYAQAPDLKSADNTTQLREMNQVAGLLRSKGFSFNDHGTWLVVNDLVHRVVGDRLVSTGTQPVTIRTYPEAVRFVIARS